MPRVLTAEQFERVGRVVRAVESRVQLPPLSRRAGALADAANEGQIWRYELTSDWTNNDDDIPEAEATITDPEDTETIASDAIIRDPRAYMDDQVIGDVGECYEYNGVYYTIQAPCTGGGGGGSSGGGSGLVGSASVLTL